MITKENNKERMCSFYASEFHLEMIILPYINKEMEENKKIIIITEENLEDSIKVLVSKINLEESRKRKILSLDWNNNYIEKIEDLKSKNYNEICIIVNGTEKFIEDINYILEETKLKDKINILNCYKIDDIKNHMQDIVLKHKKVLNTSGIQKI